MSELEKALEILRENTYSVYNPEMRRKLQRLILDLEEIIEKGGRYVD